MGRPPVNSDDDWQVAFDAMARGASPLEASRVSGISLATFNRGFKQKFADIKRRRIEAVSPGYRAVDDDTGLLPDDQAAGLGAIPLDQLRPEAARALEDFAYFRRRYLGRISSPWQEDAAYQIVRELDSPDKTKITLNCPPGVGKSTLWHDIAVWLIVRRRSIRILIVSANGVLAKQYSGRIRDTLARRFPVKADDELKAQGLAVDAEATLIEDFGLFRPFGKSVLWTRAEFVVLQHGDVALDNKEPTVAAYGLDADFIGHRANVVLADDVSTNANSRDGVEHDRLIEKWDDVVEARLEPGGVLANVQQRLGPGDITAHVAAKKVPGEDGEMVPVYLRLVYQAHDDAGCTGDHGPDAAPQPVGCLLDPLRLPWSECAQIRATKPFRWSTVYQQDDTAPGMKLVERVHLHGGLGPDPADPKVKVHYPGCLDPERRFGELPRMLPDPVVSIATVDPSGTQMWATQWWLRSHELDYEWLIDAENRRMSAEDLLGYDTLNRTWSGLMEDWQARSVAMGQPITHWVVEENGAQRYLLAHDFVRKWQAWRGVLIVPHTTGRNKASTDFGVEALLPPVFRAGRARIPYAADDPKRWVANEMIDQLTGWTRERKKGTDLVMATWFARLYWPSVRPVKLPPRQWRPSFLTRRSA